MGFFWVIAELEHFLHFREVRAFSALGELGHFLQPSFTELQHVKEKMLIKNLLLTTLRDVLLSAEA